MAAFNLPEELKPPEESEKYEKVKNPWARTSYGKSEYYWRKIPDSRKDSSKTQSKQLSTKKRKKVLERDDFVCQNCGAESSLEIHHIVPQMVGGSNELSNLVALCQECHRQVPHPHPDGKSDCKPESIDRLIKWIIENKSGSDSEKLKEWPSECKNCGVERDSPDEIEAHLIVPLSENGSLHERNISFLCSVCHSATHGKRSYARTATMFTNDSIPKFTDDDS